MANEVTANSTIERQDYQRHDRDREDRVTRQNSEINRPHEALAEKARGAVMIVVDEI